MVSVLFYVFFVTLAFVPVGLYALGVFELSDLGFNEIWPIICAIAYVIMFLEMLVEANGNPFGPRVIQGPVVPEEQSENP